MDYITRDRKEAVKIIEDLLLRYCSDYNIALDVKHYFEK